MSRKNQKGFIPVLTILIIAAVAAIAYGSYYFGTLKNKSDSALVVPTPTPVTSIQPTIDPTANWKTYTNITSNFSIKYPSDWTTWSQGPVKDAWQEISSSDLAPKGSQQPMIGMSVGIRVYKQEHIVYQDDLENFEVTKGLPSQNIGAYQVFKNVGSISETPLVTYEYESNNKSYPYHYWVMNIAENNNTNIISIVVTDFKEDKSLNTKEIASEILSSFKFTK